MYVEFDKYEVPLFTCVVFLLECIQFDNTIITIY